MRAQSPLTRSGGHTRGESEQPHARAGNFGDLAELYASLSRSLERIVGTRAPSSVIEDACQVAWGQLVRHRHRVQPECALAWLATTATHEAFGLLRRQSKFLSLEETLERYGESAIPGVEPAADETFELRERLEAIATLPERQQRMLLLHGYGLSYAEIAAATGCSVRTVERQLLRAKRRMREQGEEKARPCKTPRWAAQP